MSPRFFQSGTLGYIPPEASTLDEDDTNMPQNELGPAAYHTTDTTTVPLINAAVAAHPVHMIPNHRPATAVALHHCQLPGLIVQHGLPQNLMLDPNCGVALCGNSFGSPTLPSLATPPPHAAPVVYNSNYGRLAGTVPSNLMPPLGSQLCTAQAAVGPHNATAAALTSMSTSLYVKNLPPDTDKLFLYEKFAPYGAILSVKVLLDSEGKCRGVAFVNYADHAAALHAIQALHATKLGAKLMHLRLHFHELHAAWAAAMSLLPAVLAVRTYAQLWRQLDQKCLTFFAEIIAGVVKKDADEDKGELQGCKQ